MSERIYRDICRGYSEIEWEGKVFIKHLNSMEINSLRDDYDTALVRARSLGCKTEPELTAELILAGSWSDAKERSIKSYDEDIEAMERSKKKIMHRSQIDSIYNTLIDYRKKKEELLTEKYVMFVNSAESYANGVYRERQIQASCFRDKNFEVPAFEDVDYMEDFSSLSVSYFSLDFGSDILKKICISPWFWSLFTISENCFDFFRIPFFQLTYYQANLIKYAQTYAKIASETSDLPPEYEGNSDKMLMWWFLRKNGGSSVEEEKAAQQQTSNNLRALINGKR